MAVSRAIWWLRFAEEFGQRLIRNELRFAVNGCAETLERKSAPKRLLGGCGVHGDRGCRAIEQWGEFSAADKMHALPDAVELENVVPALRDYLRDAVAPYKTPRVFRLLQ